MREGRSRHNDGVNVGFEGGWLVNSGGRGDL